MPAIFFCQFKLKKTADPAEFLSAAKRLNDGYISKQPGYIGWQQLQDGDTWVDILKFDTMDNVKAFEANSAANPNELALEFYSYINMMSCKVRYYEVAAEHGE